MNNYLIETNNVFSLNKKIEEIIIENNYQESIKSTYNLEETTMDKALEDLDTYSLLTNKKIIIINNIDILKKDEFEKEKDHLIKYLENPNKDNLLIITASKLDNKLKIVKKLKGYCNYLTPTYNSLDIIKDRLKGYKITNTDINYLIEICNDDQLKINNECDKLSMYCIDKKEITKKDIDELVTKKYGDPETIVFSFIRFIAENNKGKAIELYRELLNYGKHPLEIVSLIASQLRTLLKIKILEEKKYTKNQISELLNKKPFYIEKQKELTRLYSINDIYDLIKKLEELDLKMKTTNLDYDLLLEMYIINI